MTDEEQLADEATRFAIEHTGLIPEGMSRAEYERLFAVGLVEETD